MDEEAAFKYEIVMDPRYLTHKDQDGMFCRTEVNTRCKHDITLSVNPRAEMIVLTHDEDMEAQIISMAFQVTEE